MSETEQSSQFNLGTVIADAKKVVTNPIDFYRTVPITGGYANPLIFVVVIAAVCGILVAILSLLGISNGAFGGMMSVGFAAIIILPITWTIASFITAAVLFVIWKLMGSEKDYQAAYRSTAYTYAVLPFTMLLGLLPYLGAVIGILWLMFLAYIASVEVAKVKPQTAKIVFGILAALLVIGNLSAERTANNYAAKVKQFETSAGSSALTEALRKIEDGEEISAEEAGKMAGEFLKGLEQFGKGLEEASKDTDD